MKLAVGYVRVSREDENPENQVYMIMKWAKEHGYIVSIFQDYAVSGAVDPFQRSGFKAMIEYMKMNNVKTIIVTELERLTRDVEHYERLKDLKKILGWSIEEDVEIISLADETFTQLVAEIRRLARQLRESIPAESRFLKPIYDIIVEILMIVAEKLPEIRISMAQAERQRASERTRRAIERLKAEGRVYTKPTIIEWIALYRTGKKSLSELTREDIEEARKYFIEQYVKPVKEGVPVYRVYKKKFLVNEKPVINMIREKRLADATYKEKIGVKKPSRIETYSSYSSFRRTVLKLMNNVSF